MGIAAIPRKFPQFGKALATVERTFRQVFQDTGSWVMATHQYGPMEAGYETVHDKCPRAEGAWSKLAWSVAGDSEASEGEQGMEFKRPPEWPWSRDCACGPACECGADDASMGSSQAEQPADAWTSDAPILVEWPVSVGFGGGFRWLATQHTEQEDSTPLADTIPWPSWQPSDVLTVWAEAYGDYQTGCDACKTVVAEAECIVVPLGTGWPAQQTKCLKFEPFVGRTGINQGRVCVKWQCFYRCYCPCDNRCMNRPCGDPRCKNYHGVEFKETWTQNDTPAAIALGARSIGAPVPAPRCSMKKSDVAAKMKC